MTYQLSGTTVFLRPVWDFNLCGSTTATVNFPTAGSSPTPATSGTGAADSPGGDYSAGSRLPSSLATAAVLGAVDEHLAGLSLLVDYFDLANGQVPPSLSCYEFTFSCHLTPGTAAVIQVPSTPCSGCNNCEGCVADPSCTRGCLCTGNSTTCVPPPPPGTPAPAPAPAPVQFRPCMDYVAGMALDCGLPYYRGWCDTTIGLCVCNQTDRAWQGLNCDILPCIGNCNGGGQCTLGSPTSEPFCTCFSGFSGIDCGTVSCPQVNGIDCNGIVPCTQGSTGGICDCPAAYRGTACQYTCTDPTCSGNGLCDAGVCRCNTGWGPPAAINSSTTCSEPYVPCPVLNCNGHGTCNLNNGTCTCRTEGGKVWSGTTCNIGRCLNQTDLGFDLVTSLQNTLCYAALLNTPVTLTQPVSGTYTAIFVSLDGLTTASGQLYGCSGNNCTLSGSFQDPGTYYLILENGCASKTFSSVRITYESALYIFYATPRFAYTNIGGGLQIMLWVTGLTANATSIELSCTDCTCTCGCDTVGWTGSGTTWSRIYYDAQGEIVNYAFQPGRPRVTLPQCSPIGNWSVKINAPGGCDSGKIDDIFMTVGQSALTLTVSLVDPPFVYQKINTGVLIRGTGFQPVPDVVMTPAVVGGGAILLKGTTFLDQAQLQTIVPGRLLPGAYHVMVVNPFGQIGLKLSALTVVIDPPPILERIIPGYLNSGGPSPLVSVLGQNFRNGAYFNLYCQAWDDPTDYREYLCGPSSGTTCARGGTGTCLVTGSSFVNSSLITGNFAGGTIGAGYVCVVRIVNPDCSYFDYSAVVTRTPSNKLEAWQDYSDPGTANNPNPVYDPNVTLRQRRRGARMIAGAVTSSSKYLYVCGGDRGYLNGCWDTCEFAPLDKFGNVLGFVEQTWSRLPKGLTFGHMNVISRFVYWTGGWYCDPGNNVGGPIAQTFRAEILDPLKTPELEISLTLSEGGSGGVATSGLYYYRVSAYFAPLDVNNPAGESLCGETLSVFVPAGTAGFSLQVVITWDQIPDAIGYFVYRSVNANDPATTVTLLATVVGGNNTRYYDYGQDQFIQGFYCQPQGSLGKWHEIWSQDLFNKHIAGGVEYGPERWGHVSVTAPVGPMQKMPMTCKYPSYTGTTPCVFNDWFLTILTGKDNNNYLSTYEAIRVRQEPDPIFTKVREFQTLGSDLPSPYNQGWIDFTGAPLGPVTDPRFLSDATSLDWADLPGIGPLDRIHVIGIGFVGDKNLGVTQLWLAGNWDSSANAPKYRNNAGTWANKWQEGKDPSGQNYGYCMLQAFGLIHAIGGVDGNYPPFGTTCGTSPNPCTAPLKILAEGRILPNPGLCGSDTVNVNLDNVFSCSNWAGEPNLAAWQIAYPACARANGLFFMVGGQPNNAITPIQNCLRSSN